MITYLYWIAVLAIAVVVFWVAGIKYRQWIAALAGVALVLAVGSGAYYFHYQQVFVKRWGGVMSIEVPKGQHHIAVTWKEDNLWVENYDPATNTCEFREYSRGDLLQGRVVIKNCNPLKGGPW